MEDKAEQHISLDPWIYGPIELIQHAEGHLKANGDFDKRMALISYDNAIELTITTFLQLHPSQRNGLEYPKSEIDKYLANYHTKLDFFEMYVKSTNQKMKIPKPNIIWSHKHRNELYHDGKGMVPEERILKGIRAAAFYVFSTLFNIDVEDLLKTPPMLNRAEQIKSAKQRDDEQYASYIETWSKYIDLDNWTAWTSYWILASTMPKISYKQLDNLEELELWLLSTIWPNGTQN